MACMEINSSLWAIQWRSSLQDSVDVKCGCYYFRLESRLVNMGLALSLREIKHSSDPRGVVEIRRGNISLCCMQDQITKEVKLSLQERPEEDELAQEESSTPLLSNIVATLNGLTNEMESDGGQWKTTFKPFCRFWDDDDFPCITYHVILKFKISADGERQLLTHLTNLLDRPTFADMTFLVKDEKISAHAAIVMSGSPVMCAIYEANNYVEGHTKTVKEEDIEPDVFKEMLRFLYTEIQPKLDTDAMTIPLLQAADKYLIEGLRNLCEQTLIARLNEDSIVDYLIVSYHFAYAPRLWNACVQFLADNGNRVYRRQDWEELSKNDHQLMKALRMRR